MKSFILIPSLLAGLCCSAMAAPFVFNNGDVVLGFQATSGTGSDKNVFFRIGSGTALRDGTISGNIGNIGTTLAATFGANWYTRTDLYCGAIGNLNTGSPSGTFGVPAVNGDPSRTFYMTKPATYPRTGEIIAPGTYVSSALGSIGTKFAGMESMLATLTAEADTSAIINQLTPLPPPQVQTVEWQNGWSFWNPIPGAAFDTISGGLQQNFGKTTPATFLDLQRVLSTSTGASPTGTVGGGDYVTTIYIKKDGTISVANTFYFSDGDVVLGFQATSGTGSDQNVFFRLGSTTDLRNGLVTGTLGNLSATLAATYGSNWFSRSDLYCGAIGNLNNSTPGSPVFTPAVDGDPSRTLYATQPASFPKEADLVPAGTYVSSALGSIGTKFSGMETMVATLAPEADFSAVLDQLTPLPPPRAQVIEWSNSWSTWNPVPGAAFDVISGGIQQNFGKSGSAIYLDLQRILATNTNANPTGVVGGGTYVATIEVDSNGNIKLASTTPFQTWVNSFPAITDPADKLTTADFDNDSYTNFEEFAFGGDPANPTDNGIRKVRTVDANANSIPDLTLTVEVRSGATFTSFGGAMLATIDNVTYRIEGSGNLTSWSSAVSEVDLLGSDTPSPGYVLKTFRLNAAEGFPNKGFLRAGVVK